MAQRNGRNFGNSTPPTIYGNTYGTYYDISNMPKREDAFTGYRTGRVNAERYSQDYSRPPSARRGLPFQGAICTPLDEFSPDVPYVDRGSSGKHRGGLIRNPLLEEICSDYSPLDLFEIESHYPATPMTRIPDYLSEVDQVIPFGKIGEAEEVLAQQREQKYIASRTVRGIQNPCSAVINICPDLGEKGQNPSLTYTNLDPFSRKGSKTHDLNEAVASPTISSSCEPEKVLSSGSGSHCAAASDGAIVHSTTNSTGVQSGVLEDCRGRDVHRDLDPLHRGPRTSSSDAVLQYSRSFQSPVASTIYQDTTSHAPPPTSVRPLGVCFKVSGRNEPSNQRVEKELESLNDPRLENLYGTRSPSVSSAAKLEEALPSELINVKTETVVSTYGVAEQPGVSVEGGESNATSSSTSPSQIHVAKKQRTINCASDLLEDVRESYAFTQGANPYAPIVHPTFTDPMTKTDMHQTYRFQPPQESSIRHASVMSQREMSFNFGTTASGFGGVHVASQFQPGAPSAVSHQNLVGNKYYGYGVARPSAAMTPSSQESVWFSDGRQAMGGSPGAYQSCPDLSSPENTPGMLNPYSTAQMSDSSRYGRPYQCQPGFNPNVVVRQSQPLVAYDDRDDYPLSPASQLRQQTSSAPTTPSKHGWGSRFPLQETVRLRQTPSGFRPVSLQYSNAPESLVRQDIVPQVLAAPGRKTGSIYFDQAPLLPVSYGASMEPSSRAASSYCSTPQMQHQMARNASVQRQYAALDSQYCFRSPDIAPNVEHELPLAQQKFMQQLIRDDSRAFRSHPLFPLLRDILIADMNFHTPKFPFPLVAHLPMDFGRLLHNYITRNPGINLDQGDPTVHSVFMEGLKFAHSTLIGKIQARKLKEGYQDCVPSVSSVEDVCDSFARSVKPSVSSYGVNSSGGRGSMIGDMHQMTPEYSCTPPVPVAVPGTGPESSGYPLQQTDYSASPYASVDCGYQMPPVDMSSSVPFGLNIPQHVYLEADRRTHSLPSSPRKLIKQVCYMGDKDRMSCGAEAAGEKTGKNKVLPRESVSIMLDWLREHQENPYPNDDEKESLIASTKLNITQINYWFTNARRRILPKWALQRHMDEQEKARQASTHGENRSTSSPVS